MFKEQSEHQEDNSGRRIKPRPKILKRFGIETKIKLNHPEKSNLFYKFMPRDWYVRQWYRTEKQRDEGLKTLKKIAHAHEKNFKWVTWKTLYRPIDR